MNVKDTSVLQCVQGIVQTRRKKQTGTIINVASIAGQQPVPGWGAYSVSNAAVIALSKTLSAEERQNGIRVVSICPGAVNTPLWDTDTVQVNFDRSAMLTPELVAESILHAVLMPEQAVVESITLMSSAGALD